MIRALGQSMSSRFSRDVWLICAASALFTGAFLGLRQLLTSLYTLRLGYGPEFVGIIFGAGAISFAAASVPGGALGGRFGPRRMMIIGAVQNIAGMALIPFTEGVPEGMRSAWILLSQVISSSGWSVYSVNMIPTMAAATSPESRRSAYAVREASAGLGMFLGAFVGGLLPGAFASLLGITTAVPAPYRYALYGPVAVGLLGLVPLGMVGPIRVGQRSRAARSRPAQWLPLILLAACAFANNGAIASVKAFSSAYMDLEFAMPTSLIGTIVSAGMLLGILSALISPRLARWGGSGHTMRLASILLAANLLQMALFPQQLAAAIGVIAMFALWTLWRPAFQALQMEMAEPGWRALVSGMCAMGMSLGFGAVSFGGGYIVTALGYRRLFLIGAGISVASAILMSILIRMLATQRSSDELEGRATQLELYPEPMRPS